MDSERIGTVVHTNFDRDPHVVSFAPFNAPNPKNTGLELSADLKTLERDGYIIIRNLLSSQQIEELKEALRPFLTHKGRNTFEGTSTQRVYALLSKSRAFDALAMHPRVLQILDNYLLPNYLLTAYQAIKILPGETRQPFHHDDQFVSIPRPHNPFSIGTIWAIDEFTAENGATLIFPGSHKWGDEEPPKDLQPLPCVMPAGSVVIFLSTLWHGGGANTSDRPRLAISAQYCEPWIRPQENQFLSIPFSVVPRLDPVLQSLIGYNIHPPFVGHVNGMHPLKQLSVINEDQRWKEKAVSKL